MKAILRGLVLFFGIAGVETAQAYDCASPENPTQAENCYSGTDSWRLENPSLSREIEGYASLTSVNKGEQISLFVSVEDPATDPSYAMDVFRMGWYGGAGGRLMVSLQDRSIAQPVPRMDPQFGTFDCDWSNQTCCLFRPTGSAACTSSS